MSAVGIEVLSRQWPASKGKFGQPVGNGLLQFRVVGVQIHCFACGGLQACGKFKKEGLGCRVYRPNRFDATAAGPFGRTSNRVCAAHTGHAHRVIG